MSLRVKQAAAFVVVTLGSAAAECTQPDGKKKSFAEMWQSNFAAGQNAYIVEIKDGVAPHRPQGDGHSLFSYCLPKGSDGNVLNPFIETKLHKSMFWQFGKLACEADSRLLGLRRRRLQSNASIPSAGMYGPGFGHGAAAPSPPPTAAAPTQAPAQALPSASTPSTSNPLCASYTQYWSGIARSGSTPLH